jgi:dCMP deaminase
MRPSKHEYFLEIAKVVATRSTCARRQVGCVLVDFNDRIIATGHNGTPIGIEHCIEAPCKGASMPSGTGLEVCLAVHAENNALIQCKDAFQISKCYVTASPCLSCLKALLNTSVQQIIFLEEYPHSESKDLWQKAKSKIVFNHKPLGSAIATYEPSWLHFTKEEQCK